jgi:hypothetical protein
MKEKLNEVLSLIYEGLGEYAGVTETCSPEWTHPFKQAAEKVEELFADFDKERENIRKEIEGRFIDGAVERAENIGGEAFLVGQRKHRGQEYKVFITVTPIKKTEMPKMACPKCGALQDDFDGLSFSYCPACGYCSHPNGTVENGKMVCGICGREVIKGAKHEK